MEFISQMLPSHAPGCLTSLSGARGGSFDKPELPELQVDEDEEGRGHLVMITGLTGLEGLRARACCLGCCLPGQLPQGAADLHFGLGRVPAARKARGAARLPEAPRDPARWGWPLACACGMAGRRVCAPHLRPGSAGWRAPA